MKTRPSKKKLPNISLRLMNREDCASIACLQADLDASPWNTDQWLEAYQHSPEAWIISGKSEDGELILGYAIYRAICEQAELLNFGVRREYQGQGIGQDFLESTLSLLPKKVEEVLLEVRRSNIPAINLYSKIGFNEATVRRDYYPVVGGGREDAIVMIKVLET